MTVMRLRQASILLFTMSILSFFYASPAFSAAFQIYELGTPLVGRADVGQSVVTEDASSAYFNPAAMVVLPQSQFMLGSQLLLPYTNFAQNPHTTISGDNGGNAASLAPGLDFYYVYHYSKRLSLGLSFTSPYGGSLTYNDGWVGRYIVQTMQLYTLNLNPAIAYQVNDWFSVGAGVSIEYANLQETSALPLPVPPDGQVNVKLDNFSPGFNVGVLFLPTANTKIGLAYRSQITHHLRGRLTFLRLSATPNASTKMIMPHNLILSISQRLHPQWLVLAELGVANWASMQNTILQVDGYSAVTPRNWNNTYRIGLASQYQCLPTLLLQAGASFDSSPASSTYRLPDLPMDRQIRLGAGLIYALQKAVQLGLSYEYLNFGNANINNTSSNGTLRGSYSRNYANAVQISLNVEA
jgi:long-chain fatty acid transport protein